MNTISPGLEDTFAERTPLRMPRFLVSPAFWAGVSMVTLFGLVALVRLGVCVTRVLACAA